MKQNTQHGRLGAAVAGIFEARKGVLGEAPCLARLAHCLVRTEDRHHRNSLGRGGAKGLNGFQRLLSVGQSLVRALALQTPPGQTQPLEGGHTLVLELQIEVQCVVGRPEALGQRAPGRLRGRQGVGGLGLPRLVASLLEEHDRLLRGRDRSAGVPLSVAVCGHVHPCQGGQCDRLQAAARGALLAAEERGSLRGRAEGALGVADWPKDVGEGQEHLRGALLVARLSTHRQLLLYDLVCFIQPALPDQRFRHEPCSICSTTSLALASGLEDTQRFTSRSQRLCEILLVQKSLGICQGNPSLGLLCAAPTLGGAAAEVLGEAVARGRELRRLHC
mmetsp:Transcript_64189/g.184386  ORF Transcript_64189/g.184386 Transcript_64189/m.184386 type:complete len:333 (+) Transcript_64189:1548-2546(+)